MVLFYMVFNRIMYMLPHIYFPKNHQFCDLVVIILLYSIVWPSHHFCISVLGIQRYLSFLPRKHSWSCLLKHVQVGGSLLLFLQWSVPSQSTKIWCLLFIWFVFPWSLMKLSTFSHTHLPFRFVLLWNVYAYILFIFLLGCLFVIELNYNSLLVSCL